jgi:hypothetical protein
VGQGRLVLLRFAQLINGDQGMPTSLQPGDPPSEPTWLRSFKLGIFLFCCALALETWSRS